MKKVLLALAIASAAPLAFANAYVGATYNRYTFDETDAIGDFGLNSLAINGGYKFNDIIAAEARIGFGLGDDTRNQQTAKLRNYLGLYAKAGIPLGGFYPYALLGFTRGDFRRSSNLAPNASTTETGFSYGVGVAYNFSDQISVNVEYASLLSKSDAKLRGFSIGAGYNF